MSTNRSTHRKTKTLIGRRGNANRKRGFGRNVTARSITIVRNWEDSNSQLTSATLQVSSTTGYEYDTQADQGPEDTMLRSLSLSSFTPTPSIDLQVKVTRAGKVTTTDVQETENKESRKENKKPADGIEPGGEGVTGSLTKCNLSGTDPMNNTAVKKYTTKKKLSYSAAVPSSTENEKTKTRRSNPGGLHKNRNDQLNTSERSRHQSKEHEQNRTTVHSDQSQEQTLMDKGDQTLGERRNQTQMNKGNQLGSQTEDESESGHFLSLRSLGRKSIASKEELQTKSSRRSKKESLAANKKLIATSAEAELSNEDASASQTSVCDIDLHDKEAQLNDVNLSLHSNVDANELIELLDKSANLTNDEKLEAETNKRKTNKRVDNKVKKSSRKNRRSNKSLRSGQVDENVLSSQNDQEVIEETVTNAEPHFSSPKDCMPDCEDKETSQLINPIYNTDMSDSPRKNVNQNQTVGVQNHSMIMTWLHQSASHQNEDSDEMFLDNILIEDEDNYSMSTKVQESHSPGSNIRKSIMKNNIENEMSDEHLNDEMGTSSRLNRTKHDSKNRKRSVQKSRSKDCIVEIQRKPNDNQKKRKVANKKKDRKQNKTDTKKDKNKNDRETDDTDIIEETNRPASKSKKRTSKAVNSSTVQSNTSHSQPPNTELNNKEQKKIDTEKMSKENTAQNTSAAGDLQEAGDMPSHVVTHGLNSTQKSKSAKSSNRKEIRKHQSSKHEQTTYRDSECGHHLSGSQDDMSDTYVNDPQISQGTDFEKEDNMADYFSSDLKTKARILINNARKKESKKQENNQTLLSKKRKSSVNPVADPADFQQEEDNMDSHSDSDLDSPIGRGMTKKFMLRDSVIKSGPVGSLKSRSRKSVTIVEPTKDFIPTGRKRKSVSHLTEETFNYSMSSPKHIQEVTMSQTPTLIQKKQPTPRKILSPLPAPEGLRRSKRHRVQPLKWYKNERIDYEVDNTGSYKIAGIIPATNPSDAFFDLGPKGHVVKSKKVNPKKKKLKKKGNGMKDRRLSIHTEIPMDYSFNDGPEIAVLDSETDNETLVECVWTQDYNYFVGPEGEAAQSEDPFIMCKGIKQDRFCVGDIIIRPLQEKPTQLVKNHTMVFRVLSGKIAVSIHSTTCIVATGDVFFVPKGNVYRIKNLRNDEAQLCFWQLKA